MKLRYALLSVAATAALAGCAGLHSLSSDVATFGEWPSGRAPGTYAIERLPSQQARGPQQDGLEGAARGALEQAGFQPAKDAASADVLVQIGARVTRYEVVPFDDPLWWRWGPGYWHRPSWRCGIRWCAWPPHYESEYEREVGVLIRDRRSGTPLYEARASNSGYFGTDNAVLAASFAAALKDFPNAVPAPHRVTVEMPQ